MNAREQDISREVDAFTAAWNAGDARLAATFFTEDGVRVGAFGDKQRGRAELEAAFDKMFHGPLAGGRVTQERGTIRPLTPDLAVWQGGLTITTPAGRTMTGHVVQIMQRVGERWLILEAHPKFFPSERG